MHSTRAAVLVVAMCLLALPLMANELPPMPKEDFVIVKPTGEGVAFVTEGWGSLQVTISGPEGVVFDQSFEAGEIPRFSVFDDAGEPRCDGEYYWSLVAEPRLTDSQQSALKEARYNNKPRPDGIPMGGVDYGDFSIFRADVILPGPVDPDNDKDDPGEAASSTELAERFTEQVINGNLTVYNSLCVGFDCPNNPSYGSDTIRLQENNLRIHFEDTSTAASYPRNDWRIVANSASNGGSSYLAFQDVTANRFPFVVRAAARANALYVDAQGDIGLGTTNPAVELHAVGGDTPTVRLDQNGSSGFSPQTWDLAGNETSFFIRDVSNGSTLPFRIRPGAASQALVIDEDSQIGIGTLNPAANIEIDENEDNAGILLDAEGGGGVSFLVESRTNGLFTVSSQSQQANIPFQIFGSNIGDDVLIVRRQAVGIGTTNPTNAAAPGESALEVNGPIYQRGNTLYADYVFQDDYELLSIEEQAAFMNENKHLPAVPGRRVAEDGKEVVEIGARNMGMLEELEKAHLYIVELHDELESVKAVNDELLERLAALEEAITQRD